MDCVAQHVSSFSFQFPVNGIFCVCKNGIPVVTYLGNGLLLHTLYPEFAAGARERLCRQVGCV